MKKDIIFSLSSPYRDDFRVTGYRFGKGEKTCCIIGSLRGNEIQQLYMCSQLVKTLEALERKGDIAYDREILIIPSINSYGTNIGKRFWCLDNTDINRMFPGDPDGETTERIAAGIFKEICKYQYGVQFASFYISGMFIPHVRMMKTCKENTSLANLFGLPYVVLRTPTAMDQSTLNFNWQVGGTAAFSVYTNATESIDEASAELGVSAVLRFLSRMGIIKYKCHGGYMGTIIDEDDMMNVTCGKRAATAATCRQAETPSPCVCTSTGRENAAAISRYGCTRASSTGRQAMSGCSFRPLTMSRFCSYRCKNASV